MASMRGIVLDNIDPLEKGRVMVQVPDVSNVLPSTWGDALLSFCRHAARFLRDALGGLGCVGRVRAGAILITPFGLAATSHRRPSCQFPAVAVPDGTQAVVVQTGRAESAGAERRARGRPEGFC